MYRVSVYKYREYYLTYSRIVTICLEFSDRNLVAKTYHLVEEKVEFGGQHLSTNRLVSTQPYIRLLGDGCVEEPFAVGSQHFWEGHRVAVFLAKFVIDVVLV